VLAGRVFLDRPACACRRLAVRGVAGLHALLLPAIAHALLGRSRFERI
jgi:hypothetical protein